MRFETRLIAFDAAPDDPHRPVATPIYQTATFEQESAFEFSRYDYTRSGNPTRTVLESQLAALEEGSRAFAFASGMAALSAATRLVPAGGRIVAGDDLYGGTSRLLSRVLSRYGIEVVYADLTDAEAAERVLADGADLVLVETPTNPLQRVVDIRSLAALAHERGAHLAVDNSLLSPYLQRPLALGADLVIHSATKFLSGHADLSAGAVVARDAELAAEIAFVSNAEGTALSPFDSWLLLRGLKTLAIRIDRQEENARRLALFLREHPLVTRVHYVGLDDHPGRNVHASQASGAGSVLAFETGSTELSRAVVEETRLFKIAVSFGSVGSVASLPCRMSHASIPEALRNRLRPPEDLVRLSVGIESPDDLLADLSGAFDRAAACVAAAERTAVRKSAP